MVKEPSLPYYLPIAGGRVVGCIPFPRVLALCEMYTASSRIRTQSKSKFLKILPEGMGKLNKTFDIF